MAKLYFNSARGIGGSLRAWAVDLTHGTGFFVHCFFSFPTPEVT